jgi:PAS domain S-box-containing protein
MQRVFRHRDGILAAIALATVLGVWFFATRLPPIPNRPLRIGFEKNPPVQIRTANGFSGLAVETVAEAAKRAGIQLQWVETGTSSDQAFEKGLVDLWPLMTDLPDRRKRLHFSRPWLQSSHALLVRAGTETPDRDFKGRIACFRMPLHLRILREWFPGAWVADFPTSQEVVEAVCKGTVSAAFLTGRPALAALRDKPHECDSVELRLQILPIAIQLGVASTFEAARAADKIRSEIDNLFQDGTFAVTISKYSYYGLDDTWATFNLMRTMERARWMAWGIAALLLALAVTLWQASFLRRARRTAEEANAKTSKVLSWYEMAARAANDALVECDLENGSVTWNESVHVLFRYKADQVQSDLNWWAERIHPEDRKRVSAGIRETIARGAHTWSDEYRFQRGDGSYASVVDRGYLLYEGGKAARLVRAIMDVTTQRSLETQLRQAQKMEALGRLAGGVAHDFNNLLTVIGVYSELALQDLTSDNRLHEVLTRIKDAGQKGGALTQQLLAFSRRQISQVKVLDLNAIISDTVKILARVIGEDIELVLTLDPSLGLVRADDAQIHQVLMNLAVNARDAMPAGGKLIVASANIEILGEPEPPGVPPGTYVLLTVTDTGSGMDAEVQAHLFEPFFTTKEPGKGTGLGLSTVYAIVRQSNGFITVSSEEAKGASFRIFLPRAEAGVSTAEQVKIGTGADRGGETVLLVEDQEDVRSAVAAILNSLGYEVLQAVNADAALSLSERNDGPIHILLTDVLMPGMNGCALADCLQSARPGISVVYMSGYTDNKITIEAMKRPRTVFLQKPFTKATLSAKLRESLQFGHRGQSGRAAGLV